MAEKGKTILAKNLIKYRKKYGVTQEVIASAVGIERSRYAHYENDTTPTADVLRKLAMVLRVTTDELLYPEEMLQTLYESNISSAFTFNELTPEEKEIILKWRLLSKQSKDTIAKSIDMHISKSELE